MPAGHTHINKSEVRKTKKQFREAQSAKGAHERKKFISAGGIGEGFLDGVGFELSFREKKSFDK